MDIYTPRMFTILRCKHRDSIPVYCWNREKIDKLARKSRNHSPHFPIVDFHRRTWKQSWRIPIISYTAILSPNYDKHSLARFPTKEGRYKRYRFFLGRIRFRARGERLPHHRRCNVVSPRARKWRRMTNETATMLAILSLILFLETSTLHVPPSDKNTPRRREEWGRKFERGEKGKISNPFFHSRNASWPFERI